MQSRGFGEIMCTNTPKSVGLLTYTNTLQRAVNKQSKMKCKDQKAFLAVHKVAIISP